MVTNKQIKKIYALLPALLKQDADMRADLIIQFTDDVDKSSTKDLTTEQAERLILFLQFGVKSEYAHFASFDNKNSQHRQVLAAAHELGWVKYNKERGRNFVDFEILGKFIAQKTKTKKLLCNMNKAEISKLIYQLNKIKKCNEAEFRVERD